MLDRILIGSSAEPTDPNFRNVTLLLHVDGSNGAQNNTFLDSSTNNFTITRNGNTTQGSFTPYGSNWSNYFNGGTDRLQVPVTSNMYLGTTYTIEAWAYYASSSYGARPIFSQMEAFQGGFAGLTLTLNTSGNLVAEYRPVTSGTVTTITGPTVVPNTWFHIALVSNSSSARLYINGTQVGSTATFGDFPSAKTNTVAVGSWGSGWNDTGIPAAAWIGYISNMRVVKGVAVYTSNFTPSTTPLTAISGTVLLTCQSNRFIDNSSVNNTLTPNGSPRVTNFAPFAPTSAYSTSANGGSAYFDGSGDYLTIPDGTWSELSTGSFTIEMWAYPNALGGYQTLISKRGAIWEVGFDPSNKLYWYNGTVYATTAAVTNGQWVHVAATWDGTNLRLFINGVLDTTVSGANAGTSSGITYIGAFSNQQFNGYISNLRVIKGTAVYTANFTPPSSPVTAITNTQLLTNFTNGAIFDNSMKNDLETVGNAQISTSVKKFGTGSMAFDGSGDYLHFEYPVAYFSPTSWTMETFVYFNSLSSDTGLFGYSDLFWMRITSSTIRIEYRNTPSSPAWAVNNTSYTFSTGTWHHLAIVVNNGSMRVYVNGTAIGAATTGVGSGAWGGTGPNKLIVGATDQYTFDSVDSFLNGYMDEVRITSGVARYTANFTAPTAPFPNK